MRRLLTTSGAEPAARGREPGAPDRVGLLVSTDVFENFYGEALGLTVEQYLTTYRNEWSWDYMALLRRAGVQPTLYVASRSEDGPRLTGDGFRVRFVRVGLAYRLFERLPTMRRSAVWRYVASWLNGLALSRGLQRAARADGLDVLFVQEYWTGRFDVLAHTLSVPVVVMDHGMHERGEVKRLKARALRRVLAATVQTDAERDKLSAYGSNLVKLPNGVDTDFFSPAPDRDRSQVIVSVGRLLDAQKCQSDLLAALALLPAPWRLSLYGTGPDAAPLCAEAARLGVQSRVTFHGFADRATVRLAYQTAGVVGMPSAYEGLPLALLEAMSCGAAVVGSDIPPIAEVVEHGVSGLIVPVHAPEALATAVLQAWQERQHLGRRATERARTAYSLNRLRDGLLALIVQAKQ